ncbi:fungal-specific transcription factor domain-containing protein [Sporodiniella umbellata]|nr:fungal-specific transcription factor domain-containing protein [Sporodiniella umbellata]
MSTVFDNGQQSPRQPEQARPKRPRSSLACIRCRKKKVKCDFVQPTCGRCAIAGLPCSYATPPRRVDGHAFDQLGNYVEELKERMQKMQSELARMKENINPFASPPSSSAPSNNSGYPVISPNEDNMQIASTSQSDVNNQSVTWKLSLSPSGLRIDTNIASVADLYKILLNGISQLNINNDSNSTGLFNPESSVYSSSRDRQQQQQSDKRNMFNGYLDGDNANIGPNSINEGGRLWEVDDVEAKKILQEKKLMEDTNNANSNNMSSTLPKETLDRLMHTCYHTCFLAYEIVDKEAFMQNYSNDTLDALLRNSIDAWVSKHGCIYHSVSTVTPSNVGEVYFKNARQVLKKCFDISSPITIQALLNLYMYQLSSERSSLAYLYIGLAIRMAQDLKFHKKEHMPANLNQRETNKRLWWSAYWLDLCAALESNRPTMVDDKDCDLEYPVRLEHEDQETGYRIHFTVYSIKLMRIRKDITKHLPSEQSGQSLLSAISRLENSLTSWLSELPQELHFDEPNFQKTNSFRDEACLILNIQYQTTWIMLHKFFLPKQDQTATPVALLSLNICTKSANLITRMLSLYGNHLKWCQFFYAMDGIVASVTIHQANAMSNEKEVSTLAQRNLIVTADVLKKSPLIYMTKICDIIESIEGFLTRNNLCTDLNELPPVNEDSINQQSISSVFHPDIFGSPQIGQPQSQPPQPNSTTSSSSFTATNMSPKVHVPSQLYQQPLPTNPINPTTPVQNKQQPTGNIGFHDPNLMGVQSNLLFNNSNIINFDVPPQNNMNTNSNNNNMNHMLFRDMGFELSHATTNTISAPIPPHSAPMGSSRSQPPPMYMYDTRADTNTQGVSSNSSYVPSIGYNQFSSSPQQQPQQQQPQHHQQPQRQQPQQQQQQQQPQQQQQQQQNYPDFFSNTELFGMPGQPMYNNQPDAGGAFDTNGLFVPMEMDMNALLYNTSGFNTFQQEDSDIVYPGGRKRVHREWEDNA